MSQSCQGTTSKVPSLISFFFFFFPRKKKEKKVFTLYTPKRCFENSWENSLPLITESELFFYAQQR